MCSPGVIVLEFTQTVLFLFVFFNMIQFFFLNCRKNSTSLDLLTKYIKTANTSSPCHLVLSSRIRLLATTVTAPLHPALSLASLLMLLTMAPLEYLLSVSSHLCLGLPLFHDPLILPSIMSSYIPPAVTIMSKGAPLPTLSILV